MIPLLLSISLFGDPLNVYGQRTGLKYFKNYTPGEYNGHHQNWAVVRDKRGILYVANNSGIKEFDGVYWRQIDIPNFTVCSLARDEAGTIYVGGKDDMGYLAPDSKGTLRYVSLLSHLSSDKRNFSDVNETHCTKQGFFSGQQNISFIGIPVPKK